MRAALVALLLVANVIPASADTVVLAKDGQPAATIVVAEGAEAKVMGGAEDLQRYVEAICGVELPIRTDGQAVEGTGLYIGECEPTTEADMPEDGLNPETYAIRVRDGNIYFTGRWPTPVRFAVVSFIEDDLGVGWFAPGDLWEDVPEGTDGELSVGVTSRVVVPGTSPRLWSGHAWTDDWNDWNMRNKTVVSEVVPRRQFQNNVFRVITAGKHAETHPEYFPLIDGERWIPSNSSDRYWRPCESNPEVIAAVVDYAGAFFDGRPDVDSFSVGMDDINKLCSCENCRAWDPEPDSYENRAFSDRHYRFVNEVAKGIAETHPDRYIGTLIYNIARQLPTTVPKLEDNVFGFITETAALWWRDDMQEDDHELTRQWAARCKHLSRYDYMGMGTMTPRVYPHTVAEQIKFDKSVGMEGMYIEVYTLLPNTAPMMWATAKLQWDHTLDVDELLDEYYARMFPETQRTMKTYFELLEDSWNTPRPGRTGWVHRNIIAQATSMSPAAVDQGFALLEKALGETDDPVEQKRIDIVLGGLRYGSYVIYAYDLSQKLIGTPVTNRRQARKVLSMVEEMARLSAERTEHWAQAPERDDLLGANLRGLIDMGYLATAQAANVEKGATSGALSVLAWYGENAPAELDDVAGRLETIGGPISELVAAWRWVEANSPENQLVNGDFEDRDENEDAAEMDWNTTGAPKGWSTWARTQRAEFGVAGAVGRENSAAAQLRGAESATYLQTHACEPGEKYLCCAWVKTTPAGSQAGAKLTIRYRTPTGAWHPRRDFEASVSAAENTGEWHPLVLMVTIPEGAGQMTIMPGAHGMEEGATALFDDVVLHLVE